MSEMRLMMKESCERFLADISSRENWEAQPHPTLPDSEWTSLTELGLSRVAMPEHLDGVGGDFGDMCEFAYISGHAASFLPLVETMLGYWLCGLAEFRLPEGSVPVLALGTKFSDEESQIPLQASAGDLIMNVRAARFATHFVVPSSEGDKLSLVLRPVTDLDAAISIRSNAADEPCDDLHALRLGDAIGIAELPFSYSRLRHVCALLHAFQMSGAMQRTLEMTITYTQERSQFGRPLAGFQAVQHMIAEAAAYVGAANRISHVAAEAWDTPSFEFLAASAKGYISEAANLVIDPAHQCFGAMGFTRECLLHVFTRRLWCWREEFGNEQFWYARIGNHIRNNASDNIWSYVTAL